MRKFLGETRREEGSVSDDPNGDLVHTVRFSRGDRPVLRKKTRVNLDV